MDLRLISLSALQIWVVAPTAGFAPESLNGKSLGLGKKRDAHHCAQSSRATSKFGSYQCRVSELTSIKLI
jgi:hypothetical protein